MRKFIAVVLSMLMVLSLAGCGRQEDEGGGAAAGSAGESLIEDITQDTSGEAEEDATDVADAAEEPEQDAAEEEGEEAPAAETESTGGKALVVYYSATGHTGDVAGYIAAETGADLFELVPANPYSSDDLDWRDDNSRVVYEHDNPDARAVELAESTVENWADYDTVFIGYPIWWGIAAWPVDGFIAANDFTGKTVIPFCTSSSSGLGESGELLAEAAGTGDWLEGERFQSSVSEETVREWVNGLGLK